MNWKLFVMVFVTLLVARACTKAPIHITEHTISNGNKFHCIYETEDDFQQAQMDGIFRKEVNDAE